MKIVICGSMAFAAKMIEVSDRLTALGFEVVLPANTVKYANNEMMVEDKWKKLELDVIKRYYNEIRGADAVLIVNESKNGIEGYVGGNGLIEMAFAHILDKKIFLLNPIPVSLNYTDEIEAMKPVVLNGDLTKIV